MNGLDYLLLESTGISEPRPWRSLAWAARWHLDARLKEVGPTTALRQWFGHDPEKWSEFRTRYFRELDSRPECRGGLSCRPPGAAR